MNAPDSTPHAGTHRETSDVHLGSVLAFGGVLVLSMVLSAVVVWQLLGYFSAREAAIDTPQFPLAVGEAPRLPPEPRLQPNPRQDLQLLRAEEDASLQSYGWVDRNRGIARIPIERAMQLTLERGLPARQSRSPGP